MTNRYHSRIRPAAALICGFAMGISTLTTSTTRGQDATPLSADGPPIRRGARVLLNVEDAPLLDLVRMMTRLSGRRFILSPRARELRVTIVSPTPVSRAAAMRACVAALYQHGLRLQRSGAFEMVVEAESSDPPPARFAPDVPTEDSRVMTWLHPLAFISPTEAEALLGQFRSRLGRIVVHEPSGSIIVTDTSAHIRRYRELLDAIDVESASARFFVRRLEHTDAGAVVEILERVYGATAGVSASRSPGPSRAPAATEGGAAGPAGAAGGASHSVRHVIALPHNNAILMIATEAAREALNALIDIVDTPGGAGTRTRLHRLQNADAEEVATLLSSTIAGSGAGASTASSRPSRGPGSNRTPSPGANPLSVRAHGPANALVITSTEAEYRAMLPLIDDLDRPRLQVFLEIAILELSVERDSELGLDYAIPTGDIDGGGGLVNFGGGLSGGDDLLRMLTVTVAGPSAFVPALGRTLPAFSLGLRALATDSRLNIVASPHIFVLDNEEALINISDSIPLAGSAIPGLPQNLLTTGLLSPDSADAQAQNLVPSLFNSGVAGGGGRRDVGTILTIRPHVNEDGDVRMEIEAEISEPGGTVEGNLSAVSIRQTLARTHVVTHDGQVTAIGGLTRHSVRRVEGGVPLLAEIPLLGVLFRSQFEEIERRNLLVLITPHVIRGRDDVRRIADDRIRERQEFRDQHAVFSGDDWDPNVDYSRTRGLVGEMLTTARRLRSESAESAAGHGDPESVGPE